MEAAPREEAVGRWRCLGDDGSTVIVVEHRYAALRRTGRGERFQPGARRLSLETGEAVRYIDRETFEVIATGKLLRRLSADG